MRARGLCSKCYQSEWRNTHPEHREREKEQYREWQKRNRDKCNDIYRRCVESDPNFERARNLWKSFKITIEQYDEMLKEQGGACAICGKVPDRERLAVDHNHETGKIRKLLCRACNTSLGNAKDSPALLRKMAEYLENF